MTQDQVTIVVILCATVTAFLWGRIRHDVVALSALLACVAAGLVPSEAAFAGFGHPAVITVACVLVLSGALQATGVVDALARFILPTATGRTATIASLTGLAAVLSGFMNNVGALALLMPIAIQVARRLDLPPGRVLMPLAFGSILGGMTTLIGTPPNLIVSGFRASGSGTSFSMFDFAPVGIPVAAAGLVFLALIGWRMVPARERKGTDSFEAGAYLTEARVPEASKAAGMSLRDLETALNDADAQVVGLIRNELRIPAPNPYREVRAGDILIIEAEPEALSKALSLLELKLEEDVKEGSNSEEAASAEGADGDQQKPRRLAALQSDEVVLTELAVRPLADIVGRSASDINLRTAYGINLLALARQGQRSPERLRSLPIMAGDVLLMQGTIDAISDFANRFGCIPLAERPLRIPDRAKAVYASAIMLVAVAGAAFGLVPAAISFAGGVVAVVVAGVLPARRLYDAIDWSVVTLLAALIPVAAAMASTGAADIVATAMLEGFAGQSAVLALTAILVVTMILSDFMNNAATAAVMCPIALGAASQLGVGTDPFLMAVAVGSSCAFLTPIGHQNNTLILGPGGFRFGDYWRMGVPLEVLVVLVGIPMILLVWPL
ncbi:citrate transporter (plasmid) [Aminobacter sp. Y103A]|uniref:SLC13 family permease n=1 Tax=Aminobacter sp. Y103A TaxID=1870862 RepID=UPI0025725A97|nr:SLC13 family permease [Aminobacter sp. SS-2016]BBD41039.1 citrate transporter [Aminobacter sp. SS-2016]